MTHTVWLRLPNQPERTVARIDAPTAEAAAEQAVRRFPFLPPAHVWIDDRALVALVIHAPPSPDGLTVGQKQHRERITRQRRAERWRQHWIDKDEAKKKAKP